MSNEINIGFKLTGDASGIESVNKGLAALQNKLIEVGRALKDTSARGVDETFTKISQSISKTIKDMSNFGSVAQASGEKIDKLAEANEKMANKTKLVQDMWKIFSANIGKGTMTLSEAEKRTLQYDSALQKLEGDLKIAGNLVLGFTDKQLGASFGASVLNKELTAEQLHMAVLEGKLKLTAGGFKALTEEGARLLINSKDVVAAYLKLQGSLSSYDIQVRKSVNESNAFKVALDKIRDASLAKGDSSGMNIPMFEKQVKVLKQVEQGITSLTLQNKNFTQEELKTIASLDRFNIVAAVNEKKIAMMGNSFKVLSQSGLTAFGNITVQTAHQMGILDKSFDVFNGKIGLYQRMMKITEQETQVFRDGLMKSGKSFTDLSRVMNTFINDQKGLKQVDDYALKLERSFMGLLSSTSKLAKEGREMITAFSAKGQNLSTDQLKRSYAETSLALRAMSAAQKEQAATQKNAELVTSHLSLQYKDLIGSSGALGERARNLTKYFEMFGGDAKLLKIELGQLNREFIIQTTSADKMANKIKDCSIKYADLLASSTKEGVAANKLTQEFASGQKTIGEYTQGLSKLDRAFTKQLSAQDAVVKNTNLLKRVYQDLLQSNTSGAKAAESFFKKYESGKIPLEIFKKELQDINKVYVSTLTEEKKREISLNHLLDLYNKSLGVNTAQSAEMWKLLSVYEATGKGLDSLKIRLKELNKEWKDEVSVANKVSTGLKDLQRNYADLAAKSAKANLLLTGGVKTIEELRILTAELKKLGTELKAEERQALVTAENVKKLSNSYAELLASESKYGKDAKQLLLLYSKQALDLEVLKTRLSAYTKELRASEVEATKINNVYKALQQQYANLINSATAMGHNARNTIKDFQRGKIEVEQLSGALKRLNSDYVTNGRMADSVSHSASALDRALGKLTNTMASYARYMISSTVLQGLQNAFSSVTDEIISHDQALHDLQAITQSTDSEIQTLNGTLIEVATNTKYTLTEIAEGMKQMAQAGYNTQEIAGGIESIANLATGSAESLSTAINLVTSTMAVFDMGMEDSAKVADMFANAVTSSRLTISGLNTTMSYIGPAAVNANIPLKDLMATLEMLSQAGIRASTQGTGMTELLSKLANPTEKFEKAVVNAGYALDDFNTQTNDWRSVMEKMITLFDGSGEAFDIFGVRAGRVALALKTQGVSAFDEFSRGLDRVGTANQMAEKSMEGLATMILRLRDNLKILGTEMLHSAVEPLRGFLQLLLSGVQTLHDFAQTGIGKVTSAVLVLATAFGTLALSLKVLALLTEFKQSILLIVAAMLRGESVTALFSVSLAKWKVAQAAAGLSTLTLKERILELVAACWSFITTPVGLALTLITTGVGLAIYKWYSYKEAINNAVQANNEFAVGLRSVRTEIDAYNKAVEEHGRDSEEAKKVLESLNSVIKNTGEQTKSTKTLMDQFSSSLGGASSSTEKTEEAIKHISKVLQDELNKKLDDSIRLLEELQKARSNMDKLSGMGDLMGFDPAPKVESTTEALSRLKEEAEKGIESAKKLLSAYSDGANNWAEGLRKTEGVTDLTNVQIEKMAAALIKTKEGFSPVAAIIYADALKKIVKEQQKAKEASEQTARTAETLSGVIKQVHTDIASMQEIPTDKAEKYIGDLTALQKDFDNWRIQELNRMSGTVTYAANKERTEVNNAYQKVTNDLQTELEKQLQIRKVYRDRALLSAQEGLQRDLAWAGNNNEAKIAAQEQYERTVKNIQESYSQEKRRLLEQDGTDRIKNADDLAAHLDKIEAESAQAQIDILNQKRAIFIQANEDRLADLEEHAQAHKALYEEMYAEEKYQLDQNLAAQNEALKGTDQTENQILIKKAQNQREYYTKLLELEKKALADSEKLESEKLDDYSKITMQMTEEGTLHFTNLTLAEKKAAEESMKIHSGVSEDGIKHFWNTVEEEKKATTESSKIMQEKFKDQETLIKASVALKKKDGDTEVVLAKKAKSELYKLGKEQLKDQISTLKERQAKYKEVIEGLKALEASLTDAIIAEKKKIKDLDKSFDDIARDMRQSAMTEEKKFSEDEIYLNKLVAEQKAAYLRGEGLLVDELQEKITELAKTQMDRANADKENEEGEKIVRTEAEKAENVEKYLRFVQKAMAVSQEMSKKTAEGLQKEKEATQDKMKAVETGLEKTESLLKKIMNEYTEFTSVSLESLEEINQKIDEIISKNMSEPVLDFNTAAGDAKTKVNETASAIDIVISQTRIADAAANKLVGSWERVAKAAREAASASASAKKSSSGSGETGDGYATGTILPGYGGGDRNPAMLEDGEAVIRKEAVRDVGHDFIRKLNARLIKRFSSGGFVSTKNISTTQIIENNPVVNNNNITNMDTFKDFGTLKLNVGNKVFPVIAHQNIVGELSKYLKRDALMGAN